MTDYFCFWGQSNVRFFFQISATLIFAKDVVRVMEMLTVHVNGNFCHSSADVVSQNECLHYCARDVSVSMKYKSVNSPPLVVIVIFQLV